MLKNYLQLNANPMKSMFKFYTMSFRNFKKSLLVFIACTFFILFAMAQESSAPYIKPSPTAAELGKYGAMPVGYYSGTPSINIPLYTLECGTFQLPISLSYHASGIKVDDIASWVGLGWSLNAGGGISVCAKGKSDFIAGRLGHFLNEDDIKNMNVPSTTVMSFISSHITDAEPDIYNFNFCGFSGQFTLDDQFNVHFLKNNGGLIIKCTRWQGDNNCTGWNATFEASDNLGNTYFFDTKGIEYTENDDYMRAWELGKTTMYPRMDYNLGSNNICQITNWMLTKIVPDKQGGYISFTYADELVYYSTPYTGSISAYLDNQDGGYRWHGKQDIFKNSNISHRTKKLTQIQSNRFNTNVTFKSNFAREDINNTTALSEIEISNGTKKFIWHFDYTHFISDFAGTDDVGNNTQKRLRLDKVYKTSGDGLLKMEPFGFKYYGDDVSELKMPPRNSFDGFDHWGYCNKVVTAANATNPYFLFPSVASGTLGVENQFVCLFDAYNANNNGINNVGSFLSYSWSDYCPEFKGGNRAPDVYYAKSFALKQIIYPTGGFTKFEFEGHDYTIAYSGHTNGATYGVCGGLRLKRIVDSIPGEKVNERKYTYEAGVVFGEPVYLIPYYVSTSNQTGWENCGVGGGGMNCFGYTLNSQSSESLSLFGADYISYTRVNEINSQGRISYHYTGSQYPSTYDYYWLYYNPLFEINQFYARISDYNKPLFPFSTDHTKSFTGAAYKRGLLDNVTYYNTKGVLVKEEINEYSFTDLGKVYGNLVYEDIKLSSFFMNAYYLQTGKSFPKKKTTTVYDELGKNPITLIEDYSYNVKYELLTNVITTGSDGTKSAKSYVYPFDFSSVNTGFIGEMKLANIMSKPIEIYSTVNNLITSGKLITYHNGTEIGLVNEVYQLVTIAPISIYPSNYQGGFHIDPAYKLSETYTNYFNGRYESYRKENDVPITYIWGCGDTPPFAKCVNSLFNNITAYTSFETGENSWLWIVNGEPTSSVLSKTGSSYYKLTGGEIKQIALEPGKYRLTFYANADITLNITPTSSSVTTADINGWKLYTKDFTFTSGDLRISGTANIDELRLCPIDAQMTTYTYEPLFGITSINDPNNVITYYQYDSLGRLLRILDNDGKILKEYTYHYQAQ